MMDLQTITEIQERKAEELHMEGQRQLDPEEIAIAEEKRKTFDLPTNAVKVDPLR